MRHLWGLLFLPGFLCGPENALIFDREHLVAWVGSCVLIPCQIKATYDTHTINITSLVWYSQPRYEINDFTGTLLYNGTTTQHTDTASPSFQGRVRFVGDFGNRNCNLEISRLKRNDSGRYGARLFALLTRKTGQEYVVVKSDKWFRKLEVDVQETPTQPQITTNPIEITEGFPTTVTCSLPYHCPDEPLQLTLTGFGGRPPAPQTETYANGVITVTLTFIPTWTDHRKRLRCLLSSRSEALSENTLELDVKHCPKLLTLEATPGPVVREGMRLSLECKVNSSNPPSAYRWYKNDVEIYRSQELLFRQATEEQSGRYKCVAQNRLGTITKELKIDVQYPPKKPEVKILTQGRIREGLHVTLLCSSRGNPPITDYIWYKRSLLEERGRAQQLHFTSIQPGDSGQYFCAARNSLNQSTSAEVTLNVLYPPKSVRLATQSRQPIKEGDTVTLNCTVGSSNPGVGTYRWYKNAARSEGGHLWTFPAPPEQDTVYKCEACNNVECTPSAPVMLDVHFVPKEVRVVLTPRGPIEEGSRADLRCAVRMANPAQVTYTWYKGSQQLQPGSAANSWTFSKVASADSGDYSCEARNTAGPARSAPVKLDVHYGPRNVRVVLNTDPEDVTEGVTVLLKCQGEANPSGHYYQWYWNGREVPQMPYQTLLRRKVLVEQSGVYRCRMTNAVSAADSEPLHLTVFYSRGTIMKRTLIGLAVALSLLILLGFLAYSLKRRKKETSPASGGRTRRSQTFFVNKVKKERLCNKRPAEEGACSSPGVVNQGAEDAVSYAAIQFPSRFSKDRTPYACIKQPRVPMAPSDETVVYSVLKKPGLPTKDDTKHDYENVASKEEDLYYASLVNLTPLPRSTYPESETDSESEESIQYASLKH